MNSKQYVIGLDYGTDSVRAVLVNAQNGDILASSVHWYQRWKGGQYCDPSINQYRQHILDHIEGMESTILSVLEQSQVPAGSVQGICVDTTGSSPIALNKEGLPLCLQAGFEENPNAMVVLWKDHTAVAEAEEINHLVRSWGGKDFTQYEGGIYSSEWWWAKILHIIRQDEAVKQAAYTWMEHCDLMTYLLVGSPELSDFRRSRCAAGHKAMWHEAWGGLPDDTFLAQLDDSFPQLKQHLYSNTFTSDQVAGTLSEEWSEKLGLSTACVIAVGTFDAHAGAIGAEVKEHTLVRIMGTSTCDIMVSPREVIGEKTVRGICGQVDGSVIPGMIGLEAGQSAFGDLLAWFKDLLTWPLDNMLEDQLDIDTLEKVKDNMIAKLSQQAEKLPLEEQAPIALDWINGRRTPDADQTLKSAIANLNLGTKAPEIFRALVEAICFGSKVIVERFASEGIKIQSVVGIGGVAKKSGFIMQTLADVLNMPIQIAVSEQAPALGAAMYAATAAKIHPTVEAAINKMGSGFEKTYQPDPNSVALYDKLFEKYKSLGHFIEHEF